MNLVQIIRNLCNSKGMTFAELERVLGFSNGQIRRWEKTKPGIDKIQKVADYFDVSVDYLLGRDKAEYQGENQVKELLNKDNSFFREITEEYNLSDEELDDIESDLKEYLEARSALLNRRRKEKHN